MTWEPGPTKLSDVSALGRMLMLMGFIGLIACMIVDDGPFYTDYNWAILELLSVLFLAVGLVLILYGLTKK
jgi:hypothetical protein